MEAVGTVVTGYEAREAWRKHAEKKQAQRRYTKSLEHPGRPATRPHGSWVTDIGEMKQGILLCSGCRHKFDDKKYSYYRTREFTVHGKCDACKEYASTAQATFFIHESLLGRKHGQCWTPR